jgi:hypothetical protein
MRVVMFDAVERSPVNAVLPNAAETDVNLGRPRPAYRWWRVDQP